MLVCKNCGSKRILCKAWVDVNTDEYNDIGTGGIEDHWCIDCEEHTEFVEEEEFIRSTS
jgi:hypothetical protein